MSNAIYHRLDVLADSPENINRIETRLKKPSKELVKCVAEKAKRPENEVATDLTDWVGFDPVENLFFVDENVNKARRFKNLGNTRSSELLYSHLCEVSKEYPQAIFLLEYSDPQYSYSGKQVIRAGEVEKEIFDGNQRAQALDWASLDIFAPFVAEWDRGLVFGSLWKEWVEDVAAAVEELRKATAVGEENQKPINDQDYPSPAKKGSAVASNPN